VGGQVDRIVLVGLGAAALAAASRRTRVLAGSTVAVLSAVGPGFVALNFLTQGVYFDVPDRYSLSAMPLVAAAGASMLDGRPRLRVGVFLVAVVAGLAMVGATT
jgi:hypothetical protein